MSAEEKTGDELADIVNSLPYNPDYLIAWLLSLVGRITDEQTGSLAHEAAREQLERLADYDTFVAAHPLALKR